MRDQANQCALQHENRAWSRSRLTWYGDLEQAEQADTHGRIGTAPKVVLSVQEGSKEKRHAKRNVEHL